MLYRNLKISFLLCTLSLCLEGKAQLLLMPTNNGPTAGFYGIIVDSLTNEPVPAAVISVVSDGTAGLKSVQNFVSDKKGKFQVTCDLYKDYHRMEIVSLGYKPYVTDLIIAGERVQDLGSIRLAPSTQEIDEVVVKARIQLYKMKGDTVIYLPRAVKTMKDDGIIEILRQMPGVTVDDRGKVFILGQKVERTYVNQKLLFGDDPAAAIRELDAKEVASIQSYDETDKEDAAINGVNAKKRKVLNIVTFKDFANSYSAQTRGEMGTDFQPDAAGARSVRYLGSGNVSFFSEKLQLSASGEANNLTPANGGQRSVYQSRRQADANAQVSGKSDNNRHRYNAGYSYRGQAHRRSSTSTNDYFATDYFTTQHTESTQSEASESDAHSLSGSYNYSGERSQFASTLNARLSNESEFEQKTQRIDRDAQMLPTTNWTNSGVNKNRDLVWTASLQQRFKSGNSLYASTEAAFNNTQTRGVRYEQRITGDVVTPLDWNTYIPAPETRAKGHVGYRFNFDKAGNIAFSSGVDYIGRAERILYTNLQTGERDLVRSEDAFDKTTNWTVNSVYDLGGKNFSFLANLGYELENRDYEDTKVGTTDRRNFHFLTSMIRYQYNKPKKNFLFSYVNDHIPVRARDFTSRINDSDPLYISTGNKSLVPTKRYVFSFASEFFEKESSYGFSAQLTALTDPIYSRRVFFKEETPLPQYDNYRMLAGSTLITPENGASHIEFEAVAMYKTPIVPLRLFFNMKGKYSIRNPEQELYGKKERSIQQAVNLNTQITTNFSRRIRIKVENTASLGFQKSFGNTGHDFFDVLNGVLEWDVLSFLYLKADYTGLFISGRRVVSVPSSHLLNLSLGCRVLKERGHITFNAYDVLNNYSSTRITQSAESISRTVSFISANYFTISFEYRFKKRQ